MGDRQKGSAQESASMSNNPDDTLPQDARDAAADWLLTQARQMLVRARDAERKQFNLFIRDILNNPSPSVAMYKDYHVTPRFHLAVIISEKWRSAADKLRNGVWDPIRDETPPEANADAPAMDA